MDSQQQPALLDVSKLKEALNTSWQYVAQDLSDEDYNSCTNRDAIEIAIDADCWQVTKKPMCTFVRASLTMGMKQF